MFRNLSKRIEVVTPVFAAGPKQRLWEILDICLRDQREAWVLEPDGERAVAAGTGRNRIRSPGHAPGPDGFDLRSRCPIDPRGAYPLRVAESFDW